MVDFHAQQLRNRAVAVPDRATYSEIARWIGFAALLVTLVLAYAWLHIEILSLNYQMEQVKKENNQLRELNSALRAENSALLNPEKIDRAAHELGLIRSNRAEVVILPAEALPASPAPNLVAEARRRALLE